RPSMDRLFTRIAAPRPRFGARDPGISGRFAIGPCVMLLAPSQPGSRAMEVTCPACASRYTADDEKIRGKTARMRCRSCDTVWLVGGDEDEMPSEKRAAVVRRGA